jgi:DNA-binding SARP family transcriptional activator
MDFKLLGSIEVSAGEGRIALGGPRPRAVLADLALHVGRAMPADQLIEDLWGEHRPPSAAHTLETYIYRLRRALHAHGPGSALVTRPAAYMLDAAPTDVDVCQFRDLASRAMDTLGQGDAATALTLVNAALALWRGPALLDVREAADRGQHARRDAAEIGTAPRTRA